MLVLVFLELVTLVVIFSGQAVITLAASAASTAHVTFQSVFESAASAASSKLTNRVRDFGDFLAASASTN